MRALCLWAIQLRMGPAHKARTRAPWGLCLHTTGSGVLTRARRRDAPPIDVALDVYVASQRGSNGYLWGGPHYVVNHDGTIYQIADDDWLTAHCGGPWRASYLSGRWAAKCSRAAVDHWRAAWPGYASPQHLFPSRSPNADYVGVEMIPTTGVGQGLRFTDDQHEAVVRLARDLAERWSWPVGWARGPRLVGHEDVQLIDRHDRGGGWDPGWLRASPYVDLARIRAQV